MVSDVRRTSWYFATYDPTSSEYALVRVAPFYAVWRWAAFSWLSSWSPPSGYSVPSARLRPWSGGTVGGVGCKMTRKHADADSSAALPDRPPLVVPVLCSPAPGRR